VSPEAEKYISLLEQRLLLLRALAGQFIACRKEFVAMDRDGMYRHIAEQEELCRQIQAIRPVIAVLHKACARQFSPQGRDSARKSEDAAWIDRLGALRRETGEAQAEVGQLNQIHGAYLRRSGRTIQVLTNFLGNYALTYARPEQPALALRHGAESRNRG
jgi:hypothetical protein